MLSGRTVDRHPLSNDVVATNLHVTNTATEFYILGRTANRRVLKYVISRPHASVRLDGGVRLNDTVIADFYVLFDYGKGTNRKTAAQLGTGMNRCV